MFVQYRNTNVCTIRAGFFSSPVGSIVKCRNIEQQQQKKKRKNINDSL